MQICRPLLIYWVLIQSRGHPSGAANQAQVLSAEGVTVGRNAMGEYTIDIAEYGVSYPMGDYPIVGPF